MIAGKGRVQPSVDQFLSLKRIKATVYALYNWSDPWPSPEYISYSHLCIVGLISSLLTRDIGQWLLDTDRGILHAGSDVFLRCDSSRFLCAWVFSGKLDSFSKLLSYPNHYHYKFLGKPICLKDSLLGSVCRSVISTPATFLSPPYTVRSC